jgi:hypothetical protein
VNTGWYIKSKVKRGITKVYNYSMPVSLLTFISKHLNAYIMERSKKPAGMNANAEIIIRAGKGKTIIEAKKEEVNTNLSSWDKQFKQAIKAGSKAEKDLFEGLENEFDKKEW